MLEIKNGRLGLYVAEHLKCNRVMTLGFEGLIKLFNLYFWGLGRKNARIIWLYVMKE